jgi:hypothetical protein
MPEKKKIKRDFPLAPTSAPQAVSDNTRVSSNYSPKKIIEKPNYKYVEASVMTTRGGNPYSKKDSARYKEGFNEARSKTTYPSFSDELNAGRLEGSERPMKFTKRNK